MIYSINYQIQQLVEAVVAIMVMAMGVGMASSMMPQKDESLRGKYRIASEAIKRLRKHYEEYGKVTKWYSNIPDGALASAINSLKNRGYPDVARVLEKIHHNPGISLAEVTEYMDGMGLGIGEQATVNDTLLTEGLARIEEEFPL